MKKYLVLVVIVIAGIYFSLRIPRPALGQVCTWTCGSVNDCPAGSVCQNGCCSGFGGVCGVGCDLCGGGNSCCSGFSCNFVNGQNTCTPCGGGPGPTPTPVGTVQGRVLINGVTSKCPGCTYGGGRNLCETAPVWNSTVTISGTGGGNFTTTACDGAGPYYSDANATAETHTVSVNVPQDSSVGYTLCYNSTSCHGNVPTAASSVNVNVPSNGYADLYWHYSCPLLGRPRVVGPQPLQSCGTNLATFVWTLVSGARNYALRIDDTSNGWSSNCASPNPGDTCIDNLINNFYNKTIIPGHTYTVWVHAINSCGWSISSDLYTVTVLQSIDLSPANATVSVGGTREFTATVLPQGAPIDSVRFVATSNPAGAATVTSPANYPGPYTTTATGILPGTATIRASALKGGNTLCNDPTPSTLTIGTRAWWQVRNADVTSRGSVTSPIPATANPRIFGRRANYTGGLYGFPGIPVGTSFDFNGTDVGSGTAGESPCGPNNFNCGWSATSSVNLKTYDYAFFQNALPPSVNPFIQEITSNSVNGGYFNSHQAGQSKGYYWYHYDGSTRGDLTITNNVQMVLDRKVVLLVENADLNISGDISIQSDGSGFFMTVVEGSVYIDPNDVGHPLNQGNPSSNPDIEAIIVADGNIYTAQEGEGEPVPSTSSPLFIRGSVATNGALLLQRSLSDDSTTPAEFFEYAPEMMLVYPSLFTSNRIYWKEVVP